MSRRIRMAFATLFLGLALISTVSAAASVAHADCNSAHKSGSTKP
ncbi:MAG TPA: hypothetical protein VL359_09565 [bacterium]|nr:hypothetical protein [bacterium]